MMNLSEFIRANPLPPMPLPPAEKGKRSAGRTATGKTIPAGTRNATLSKFAGKMVIKYGIEDGQARTAFLNRAADCEPPLDDAELETIWRSALKFFAEKRSKKAGGWKTPAEYIAAEFAQTDGQTDPAQLIPEHFTDVEQAKTLARLYGNQLRYSDATLWIKYNGTYWDENRVTARTCVHDLSRQQMQLAAAQSAAVQKSIEAATDSGDEAETARLTDSKAFWESLYDFAKGEQNTTRIAAALTEAAPYLQVSVDQLDAEGFLLNTPAGTVDLRSGEMRPHSPYDFITKVTGCSPGTDGADLFCDFLQRITCDDRELQDYLQSVAGLFLIGAVYRECLIIAYGGGGNGKSTLFNLLSFVMGDYAGALSAETLTANCRKNKSPEYAELRGKRLIIAAELEEGMRLDTAVVKKLCSTDKIYAEAKYKAPFEFVPSHTVVLYTNHLPKVGTVDKGTWDRLIVVPFNARLRGTGGEILNYAKYLFEHAGGAVLSWMIAGARRCIEMNFKIPLPKCVQNAIEQYRQENDWIHNFLDGRCMTGESYVTGAGRLYEAYRKYCDDTGEYKRSATDFKKAMLDNGFKYRKTKAGAFCYGLMLAPCEQDFVEVDEPMPFGE